MTSEILLRDGTVLGPDGPVRADVRVLGDSVVEVGPTLDGHETAIDCAGAWVGPGFVDLHAHLREPGGEWKEDIASGSAAAAAGGYTAIVAMPNTEPAVDSGHLARYVRERGREVGLVDVVPAGCVSDARRGERLAHLDDLWDAGVRLFTDDGDAVSDAALLRSALEYVGQRGGVIAQHALDPSLTSAVYMHEGHVSSRLGMYAIPAEAEEIVIARDLALVELTGGRYHVQHVATRRGVELVAEAKERGLSVTAEVTPHHVTFDHTAVGDTDPLYRVMPPLRDATDVEALRDGLRSGTIDAVATDHAPHASHEKDVPFEQAPSGVTGLEWSAAAVNTAVALDPVGFFSRLAVAPAAIAGLTDHGRWIDAGAPANLTVFDPAAEWVPERTVSRSSNSPYFGMSLTGRVMLTLLRGRMTAGQGAPLAAI